MHNIESLRRSEHSRRSVKQEVERREKTPREIAEEFRQKLAGMKKAEMDKKKRGLQYDPHFENINSEDFSDEEAIEGAEILEKYEKKMLEFDELNSARNEANMSVPANKNTLEDSKASFYAFIGNKTTDKKWQKRWGFYNKK